MLFTENYVILLREIKKDLNYLSTIYMDWNTQILQMSILPALIYTEPQSKFQGIFKDISRFIWLKKKPGIDIKTLKYNVEVVL